MFSKILIANRGEIACRSIRTMRRMGIATVGVYSDADRDSLHCQLADEVIGIGPAPSSESYLVSEKIIQACKKSGAQAIFPGYGFLSENTAFASACSDQNITFIGPSIKAIKLMGDKIAAKNLADKAGAPTVPGHNAAIESTEHCVALAQKIGYPVMLKAAAGGGGKGMRVVHDADDCKEFFPRVRSEAQSSFNDDRIFLEKFIVKPRHIEIQILADAHGNAIYLNERECSIQRRNQKIIEEAPSTFINDIQRKAMGTSSLALAAAVNYHSAGTIEYIVDQDHNYYFMEMNTRLQVEHPVTELTTGVDLVEMMIRIAAGQPLPLTQDQIRIEGWAMEARIYAETPESNFMPSCGRLHTYLEPKGSKSIRVDSGVDEGDEISIYYDPMIAKLISHGDNRRLATKALQDALDRYCIRGINTNIDFLQTILSNPRYQQGAISTNFIAEECANRDSTNEAFDYPKEFLPALLVAHLQLLQYWSAIDGQLPGFCKQKVAEFQIIIGCETHPLTIKYEQDNFLIQGQDMDWKVNGYWQPNAPLLELVINGKNYCFQIARNGIEYHLSHHGHRVTGLCLTPQTASLYHWMPAKKDEVAHGIVTAPMPGMISQIDVKKGQTVKAGDALLIIEAMKMENAINAIGNCIVEEVHVATGEIVDAGQPLLRLQ